MKNRRKAFPTRAVHAGEHLPPGDFMPVVGPIHPAVGFVYEHMDDLDGVLGTTRDGYVYPRYGSPTVAAFETATADLEGGEAAFAFASGMAAIHVALLTAGVRQGSNVLAAMDVYGATFTLLRRLFTELGVTVRLVDVTDLKAAETALDETRPVILVAETISNPLLKVADQPALIDMAHRRGAQVLIDNTFASPYLCNPCAYGADYVMHSATKFIAGHGDVLAGVIITSTENRKKMYELNKMIGSTLGPFEAWLALRGLKTLPLRLRQQCENAVRIAGWLAAHPRIAQINYPGLPTHPQHALARRLFQGKGFGAVLSFEIAGADKKAAFRFMDALDLCMPATTLGDIYTIVLHPASSSHRALSPTERAEVGISDGLVRLSVGIEDADDIIADLEQALLATG
ncbi:MAG: PLP-dependent aspartate aminotransferase family protein [Acidobacteriia bacterium]|nr:PLP-dependent aspartate aminotransferase family protein [Terriglobia bacterium]